MIPKRRTDPASTPSIPASTTTRPDPMLPKGSSKRAAVSGGTLEDPSRAHYAEMNYLLPQPSINAAGASSIPHSLAEPKVQASPVRLSTQLNNVHFKSHSVSTSTRPKHSRAACLTFPRPPKVSQSVPHNLLTLHSNLPSCLTPRTYPAST